MEGSVLAKHSEMEWPAEKRERKLRMIVARLMRRVANEEWLGSGTVAAAVGRGVGSGA